MKDLAIKMQPMRTQSTVRLGTRTHITEKHVESYIFTYLSLTELPK